MMRNGDGSCLNCGHHSTSLACERWAWYQWLGWSARKEIAKQRRTNKPICWYPNGCLDVWGERDK